ncbi:MAG: SCO family protein [Phycisphaeraceae bacterium]|nr:SCO family protein [Phycisphaeraceae bacterium]MCW5755517.1 SCO family protein [Phycisphaeraceae bacterium]
MPRVLIVLVTAALTVMITSAIMLTRQRGPLRTPADIPASVLSEPDQGLEGITIVPFTLLDQNGRTVDQSILEGCVTIIDFIFTNCPFVCPPMSQTMAHLSAQLADTPVRFMSFSVDPERDTPESLLAFAQSYNADLDRWTFATGEAGVVEHILRRIGFELHEDRSRPIALQDGSTMMNIAHPSKLMLIDGSRRVLMLASFDEPDKVMALERRARLLATAKR